MDKEEIVEVVIRYAWLKEKLKPLPIWMSEPLKPIEADWVGINRIVHKIPGRLNDVIGYSLAFYSDKGEALEYLQFDTLDIAIDQARDIAGIQPSEWRECRVSVPTDGRVLWESVSAQPLSTNLD
ncbi:MAG TPA: hypothetical protein VM911_23490 [Pyrinomonadaceae bacterium]|jgi:hypothetical protein|nr:hypothetical protein [Pyrinomonadaceae bacterium]